MKKEFVTYEQAVKLKKLGFDEFCFGFYNNAESVPYIKQDLTDELKMIYTGDFEAPLKQQVFRWFREKYNIQGYIYSSTVRGNTEKTKQFTGYIWNINGIDTPFLSTDARDELHDTYEQAESACIDKLIEIVKNK